MEDLTQQLENIKRPEAVLTVWHDRGAHRYFLETAPVLHDGSLGAPKPVSLKFIEGLADAFGTEHRSTPHGPLPGNLLVADTRIGKEKYVWWEPPGVRRQTFSESIGMEDGEYMMPGTVYLVEKKTLSVFAFSGRRPHPRCRLLKGPFFNYYSNGAVCLGNARAPLPEDLTWKAVMEHWETLFWNSENSHLIDNPVDGNLINILNTYRNEKEFNTAVLKPTGKHLSDLL